MTDTKATLALERFEELLDLYGADLARFPEGERAAAAALLAADPRAQRLHAQAAALEAGLQAMATPEPSAALRRAVAEIPLRHPQPVAQPVPLSWLPWRSRWTLFASATLVVLLGALSGSLTDDLDLSPIAAEESGVDAASADDQAIADLAELAFASDLDEELSP